MSEEKIRSLSELRFHFKSKLFASKLVGWYQNDPASYPWRLNWQKYKDPYHVWLSEIMLQQTLIRVVEPVYLTFLKKFPTVQSLAKGSDEEVREEVRGLGYYRRFRMLHAASKEIIEKFQVGKKIIWPTTFEGWKELPGIGDYTAAAVSSISFDAPVPVVDGNVERVLCRIFDLRVPSNLPKLKKIFFKALGEVICQKSPGDFNQGIMELGQLVCTPTKPKCSLCPVSYACLSKKNSSQKIAPAAKIKKKFKSVDMQLHIFKSKDKFGIIPRPTSANFLKETAGFLTILKTENEKSFDGWNDHKLLSPKNYLSKSSVVIGEIKHNITSYKIKAEVFLFPKSKLPKGITAEWVKAEFVEKKLLSNLDRKAWLLYLKNSPEQNQPRPKNSKIQIESTAQ